MLRALADLEPMHHVALAVALLVALVVIPGRSRGQGWAVPAAFGAAAALAAVLHIDGLTVLPPGRVSDWLVWLALAAGIAGAIASAPRLATFFVWIVYAALAGFVSWVAMQLVVRDAELQQVPSKFMVLPGDGAWTVRESSIAVSVVAAIVFMLLLMGDALMKRKNGAGPAWVYGIVTAATAATLLQAHLTLGFVAASMGMVTLVWVFASRFSLGRHGGALGGRPLDGRGGASAVAAIFASVTLIATLAEQLPWEAALLLLVSPIGALVTELPRIRNLGSWPRAIIGIGLVALLGFGAAGITAMPEQAPADAGESGDFDYAY